MIVKEVSAANRVRKPGHGRCENVLGTSLVYKSEASETNGQLVCFELSVPPGAGIPPHRHTVEDEAFYVLSGSIIIEGDDCGSDGIRLEQGGFFYGPRDQVHGFRGAGNEAAKLLVFITPGASITAMFGELAELSHQQPGDVNPEELQAVCGRYGITFVMR